MTPENDTPENGMSRRDELEALLPFYLNGTLDGQDLAAIEEWLATDPSAMAALDEAEAEFSGTSAANDAIRPPADALSRFSRALDAEAGPSRASAPSPLSRLWGQFMAIPASFAWAAAAVAVALVLAQAVMEPGGRGGTIEIAGSGQAERLARVAGGQGQRVGVVGHGRRPYDRRVTSSTGFRARLTTTGP